MKKFNQQQMIANEAGGFWSGLCAAAGGVGLVSLALSFTGVGALVVPVVASGCLLGGLFK